MKNGIGLRAQPNQVTFAVVQEIETGEYIKLLDKINVPVALSTPEKLKFIRNTILDILIENQIDVACIRVTESNSQNFSIERIGIEAILQEIIASSPVERYCIGYVATISAKLMFAREQFKIYVEGKAAYGGIDIWSDITKIERETLLAAFCSLKV